MARFQYTVLVSLLILVSVLTAAQAFGFGNRNGPNQQERRRQRPISSHFRQRFGVRSSLFHHLFFIFTCFLSKTSRSGFPKLNFGRCSGN